MAIFEEEFLRCSCGSAEFIEKKILVINKNALKYKRDVKTISTFKNLLETEIRYVCDKCGKELNI